MKSYVPFPPTRPSLPDLPADLPPDPADHDAIACPHVVTYLDRHPLAKLRTALAWRIKRRTAARFPLGYSAPPQIRPSDPFILVLLADQELAEGREDQASCLIEAAYDAYDRRRQPPRLRLVSDNTAAGH
ncbi:MAG TPA: hypothetical protein VFG12_06995 [Rhodopila sp.]|nr:hypothetical protein [Rhodopila sp.]